jgi:hypothetical protein
LRYSIHVISLDHRYHQPSSLAIQSPSRVTDTTAMDGPKTDIGHHEVLHDVDIIGEKSIDAEQAMHLRVLTPDELVAEKKLRTKIDKRIMPVVVTVYLLNYIDRWVE